MLIVCIGLVTKGLTQQEYQQDVRSFVSVVILMTMSHNDGTSHESGSSKNLQIVKMHLADVTFIVKQRNALYIIIEAMLPKI